MRVISHRGDHRSCPENTLAAFEAAVRRGVDGIETDIRLTADGRAVLFHDRLAPDGRPVSQLTERELSDAAGYAVPTLEQALGAWRDLWWVLELKTPAAIDATLATLRRMGPLGEVLVISFWHPLVVAACRRLDLDGGFSVHDRSIDFFSAAEAARAASPRLSTIVWGYEFLDDGLVRRAIEQGWRCLAYDAVTPDEHARCRQLGLAGLITDYPERASAPQGREA